jgi:hypothetical protein
LHGYICQPAADCEAQKHVAYQALSIVVVFHFFSPVLQIKNPLVGGCRWLHALIGVRFMLRNQ